MTLEIAKVCAEDPRPETRELAARILGDCEGRETEALLVQLMADDDERVRDAAYRVLRVKQAWLELEPFQVRLPPDMAIQSPMGQVWSTLRHALEETISRLTPEWEKPVLRQWMKLPGVGPDIHEILERSDKNSLAEWFRVESGMYGNGLNTSRQLLVSPTYRCNISCSYCYSKEWDQQHGGDLSQENLMTLFGWVEKQGIDELLLAGGEPTVYRHLELLLRTARERGIRIRLTSNGVYNKATRSWAMAPWISELTGHYDQEIMAQRPDLSGLFRSNLQAAKDSGAEVLLRYTLLESSNRTEWGHLIDLAHDLDIRRINFGFSFLNTLGNNRESFYSFNPGVVNPRFEAQFMAFIDDCENRGLEVSQSKPLPLCALTPDSLRRVINSGILRTSCPAHRREFSQNLTVNPDLTTFPCNAIGVTGASITEFEDLKSAGDYHSHLLRELQNVPFGRACESCLFFYRGICQGVCLAQHYATGQQDKVVSSGTPVHTDLLQTGHIATFGAEQVEPCD
jgi:radical SAM protein with 4Fe4S-binding SPASM domain